VRWVPRDLANIDEPLANPSVVLTQDRRVLVSTVSRPVMSAVIFNAVSKDAAAESENPVGEPSEGHRMLISIRPVNLRDCYMTPHRPR